LIPVAQREQQLDAGLFRSIRRVRWTQTLEGAYHAERVTTVTPSLDQRIDRSGMRTAWTLFTAHQYGYSISPEGGVGVGVTGEFFRPAFGSDGRSDSFTVDGRAYVPLPRQSVMAVRLAGAASSGDRGVRRVFRLGGSDGNAELGTFGSDAISLLRGFDDDVVSGTHVMLMNAELRVPIAWPQRGVGTWPIFLRSLHATVFTDIGHAWTDAARWADRKTGVGAEFSADVIAGFGLPLTWTIGAAWGRDSGGAFPDTREVYVRLGRAF
jgi:outer membrane protein assembly factor BamA